MNAKISSRVPLSLPQFIVVGAMKCGTTTLRNLLRAHPLIFMPPREVSFFAMDDFEVLAGAMTGADGRWRVHDIDGERDAYLQWYAAFFEQARADQVIGEKSPSYMASQKAARRISEVIPHARLIFMLRDPVNRAYSQYWHLVRTGSTGETFEAMLRRTPAALLQRSCYKIQIERYMERFPRGQLKFVIFEEFIRHSRRIASDVATFIGVNGELPIAVDDAPRNVSRLPRSIPLQLLRNRWLGRRSADDDRLGQLGRRFGAPARPERSVNHAADWLWAKVNPRRGRRPPELNRDTRAFLIELLRRENRGLSEMIDIDVEQYWYKEPAAGR